VLIAICPVNLNGNLIIRNHAGIVGAISIATPANTAAFPVWGTFAIPAAKTWWNGT